jgi:hypothetical protein
MACMLGCMKQVRAIIDSVLKCIISLIYLQQAAIFIRVTLSLIIGAALMSKLNIFSLIVDYLFNRSM